jgi:multidrug resistance efflux pump
VLDQNWVLNSDIIGTGTVAQSRVANLSFQVSGNIQEILVEEGDQVRAGDVIARLDPTVYQLRVNQAENTLTINQNNYEKVIAGTPEYLLAEAEAQYETLRQEASLLGLTESPNMIAAAKRLEFLRGQPLLEDVKLAEAQVEQAQVALQLVEMQLDWTELTAPFDGTITEIYRNCFESVQIGQAILQLSDHLNPYVEINLDEYEIVDLEIGDTARISFPAIPDRELLGTIVSILPGDAGSGANLFDVRVRLDEAPEWVRIGLTAEVIFPRD